MHRSTDSHNLCNLLMLTIANGKEFHHNVVDNTHGKHGNVYG